MSGVVDSNRLARCLETLARRRRKGPAEPPSWTGQILSNRGFTKSLAGFICNAVKEGNFLFRPTNVRMISRKGWEQGSPEHISWNHYQELGEEERSDFRIAFRLSLPDALLQAIVGKFLSGKIECILSHGCFAYRRGRGQPAAVETVRRFRQDQEKWVVKCDVRSFNETVDHEVLRKILAKRVRPLLNGEEWRVVKGAIEALLTMSYRATQQKGKGLLVGSALTPPLSNLYLTPLDRYLERRKLDFVRYGDDLLVFCPSRRKAKEVLRNVYDQIRGLKQESNTALSRADRLAPVKVRGSICGVPKTLG